MNLKEFLNKAPRVQVHKKYNSLIGKLKLIWMAAKELPKDLYYSGYHNVIEVIWKLKAICKILLHLSKILSCPIW